MAKRTKCDPFCLVWSSGKRAREEGLDFESVIRRLSDEQVVLCFRRMRCFHEKQILFGELQRRRLSARDEDLAGQRVLFAEV